MRLEIVEYCAGGAPSSEAVAGYDHDWAADDGTNAKSARGQRNDWLMLAPWPTL